MPKSDAQITPAMTEAVSVDGVAVGWTAEQERAAIVAMLRGCAASFDERSNQADCDLYDQMRGAFHALEVCVEEILAGAHLNQKGPGA